MFWEVNSYSESIEQLLNKKDLTLRELLDDEDLLQDYKDQNKNLVQFIHRTEIIDELVTMITSEPPTDIDENIRFKYPNIACEILTSGVPALIERLVGSRSTLEKLYAFLEQEPPLNPLLTSFCSKTFGVLLSKKSDQDWFSYQCVCLQILEFIKSRQDFLKTIYKHIGVPVIMDLLFQIVTTIEGEELRNSLYEWLKEQKLVQNLIEMLGNEKDADKHQNIAFFISELIANGRSQRQNELQKLGYVDATTDVSDPIIQALEDETTTNMLLDLVLVSRTESSIVSGVTIILRLLENPIVNEPVSDTALQFLADAEKEHYKKIVATILKQIKPRIKDLVELLKKPPPKNEIKTTVTVLSPPVGSTRIHICTLFSVLLETGEPEVITAICETDFFNTLLDLFKQYCWNNILHNQVKKCCSYAFSFNNSDNTCTPSALQTHVLEKCKVASKFIDCWKHNEESQSKENGRRLGYMGHLIDMFDSLNLLILVSHKFRALVESNLTDDELAYWKLIIEPTDGHLVMALKAQKSYLGGIDPNQSYSYDASISKDLQEDNYTDDYYNDMESNVWSTNDMSKYGLDTPFFSSNSTFSNPIGDDIFSNNLQSSGSGDVMPKNDWADFDAYFDNFQITDKDAFPSLGEEKNISGGSSGDSNNSMETSDNNEPTMKKTFAEVAASSNPWRRKTTNTADNDNNANDIKRWASVVNDIGDIQCLDQIQVANEVHTLLNNVENVTSETEAATATSTEPTEDNNSNNESTTTSQNEQTVESEVAADTTDDTSKTANDDSTGDST